MENEAKASDRRFPGAGTRNGGGRFDTTHWSVVLAAATRGGDEGEQALQRLCAGYWQPLYGFVRRSGHQPEAARDLTQEFFLRLLEKGTLRFADQQRGRFRTFLLGCLKNFLLNEQAKAGALKRGGGWPALSLDYQREEARYQLDPIEKMTPETVFEKKWAVALLEKVLSQLEQESITAGQADRFAQLKGLITAEPDAAPYAEAAARLGISEGTIKSAVHRLRSRYVELFRREIRQTVDSPEEAEDEIRHLFRVLTG